MSNPDPMSLQSEQMINGDTHGLHNDELQHDGLHNDGLQQDGKHG